MLRIRNRSLEGNHEPCIRHAFFISGSLLGSYYYIIGTQFPVTKSLQINNLQCLSCKRTFSLKDVLPYFGYLSNKGRCRSCGTSISWLLPICNLLTGVLFAWAFLHIGWNWELLVAFLLISLSCMILVTDLKYMVIPNRILLLFFLLFLPLRLFHHPIPIYSYILGFVIGGGLLFLIAILSRGGMGMGDVKLFFVYGWAIGFPNILVAFFIGTIVGGIIGGILLLIGFARRKEPIPFGPFLAFGTIVAYGYGEEIIYWYFSTFA